MKKIVAVSLLLLITLSSMGAKSYVGLSLSPYFEFGSGSWMGKDGDSDAAINVTHDEKLFVFGAEFRLDLGLYKTWGKHSLGVEVGTGIALPVIHKNDVGNAALQINDIPLYTYALTPYAALTYLYSPTNDFSFGAGLGIESTVGWLNERLDDGDAAKGHAYDYFKYFIDIPMMYSFTDTWAMRWGISVSMTPLLMIENYTREVYDNTGELLYDTMSSASIIFRIKPYIGVAYTF